jgi:thioredoxin-like negative regulator of GroEL
VKRRALAACCLILISFAIGGAQNRAANFNISGKVIVPDAHFQDLFEVLLVENLAQPVQATVADSQGRYRFSRLPRGGTYFIVVKIDGYEEVRQRVDVILPGETVINIIMNFKEERIVRPAEDFSGEDFEVVDLSELERTYPAKILDEVKAADREVREHNFQKALPRLEAVVRDAPDLYFAHRLLGTVYQKLNRVRDAESEFKTAADLKPTSAAPFLSLGSLYLQEAESNPNQGSAAVRTILNEALGSLNAAIKLKPDAAFAYYLRGVTYYRSAFYEDAEENLKMALDLSSALTPARLALANVYIKMQEWPNALAQLDAYLAADPRSPSRAEVEKVRAMVSRRLQASVR